MLVLPPGYDGLRNPGFLRFVRRHAMNQGKAIALVTSDWVTRRLAREVGVPVYRSPSSVRPPRKPRPEHPTGAHRLAVLAFSSQRFGLVSLVFALLLGTAAALGTSYAAVQLLPSATVTLTPASSVSSEVIEITATSGAQRADGQTIPARIVSVPVEVSDTATTTGVRVESANRAFGDVQLLNVSEEPVTVPRDTIVATSRNQQYRISEFVTLLPNQPRRAPIGSITTGGAANADTGAITRILNADIANKVTVYNDRPVIGGVDRALSVVSVEDQNRLKAGLIERMKTLAYERLYAAKRESESIYLETVNLVLDEEGYDHAIGVEAASIALRLKGTVTGIAFESSDVNKIADQVFKSKVRPGTQAVPGSYRTAPLEAFNWDDQSVSFRVLVEWRASRQVDPESVRTLVAGLTPDEAERKLLQTFQLATKPGVQVFPAWVSAIPTFGPRVTVKLVNDTK